jgi:pilus assembly protein Flp/PilA
MERIKDFFKDDSGATAVEYALLLAVVSISLIVAITGLKNAISGAFNSASTAMNSAS